MKKESFPISETLVEEFININNSIWNNCKKEEGLIFVNFSMVRLQMSWIIPKLLYAKALQKETGARVIVFTWNENELFKKMLKSYGFEHISLNSLCRNNMIAAMKAIFIIVKLICGSIDGDRIKGITVGKVRVGKYIYEDIIRTSELSTIHNCHEKTVLKKVFHLTWTMYALKHYNKKNRGIYALIDDYAYHEGAFIQLFKNWGIKVISANNYKSIPISYDEKGESERIPRIKNKYFHNIINDINKEKAIEWAEKYLEERFKGNNGSSIDRGAFLNKMVLDRDEFIRIYGIDENKKNIVIMAHTFTDAIYNYGEYYFRDYYDWTEKTLKIATTVKNVNWILKPHPTRGIYNESIDSIEKMFEKYKKSNMFILNDSVSAESIKNIADVIITIGGNAGAEFACFGVPSVIVGTPYYKGFGYTIEPKDYSDYKKTLETIAEVEHLNEDQRNIAKIVFYLNNSKEILKQLNYYDDECSRFNFELYKKMLDDKATQYFNSNEGTKSYNDNMIESWMEYMRKNDIKDTEYYKAGLKAKLYFD